MSCGANSISSSFSCTLRSATTERLRQFFLSPSMRAQGCGARFFFGARRRTSQRDLRASLLQTSLEEETGSDDGHRDYVRRGRSGEKQCGGRETQCGSHAILGQSLFHSLFGLQIGSERLFSEERTTGTGTTRRT